MELWQFVIAKGISFKETTDQTREFLRTLTIDNLKNPKTWEKLTTLVRIRPQGDIFPVRAKYADGSQYTIGLNHLTYSDGIWYTLADCIALTLLTGRLPEILEAITFTPLEVQENQTVRRDFGEDL